MVLDHLLSLIQPQSYLEWIRTSFEQSRAEFYTILLEEHLQVTLEMLEKGICCSLYKDEYSVLPPCHLCCSTVIFRNSPSQCTTISFCQCWFSPTIPLRWCCLPMIHVCRHNLRNCCARQFLSQMLQLNAHKRSVLFQNRTSLPFSDSFIRTVIQYSHLCTGTSITACEQTANSVLPSEVLSMYQHKLYSTVSSCLYCFVHPLYLTTLRNYSLYYWKLTDSVVSGQGSWLQIQRFGFDSRRYQIFWEVVGLDRGSLSLVRMIEELFQGNSGSGLENRN
jgi:hypothetical protein